MVKKKIPHKITPLLQKTMYNKAWDNQVYSETWHECHSKLKKLEKTFSCKINLSNLTSGKCVNMSMENILAY